MKKHYHIRLEGDTKNDGFRFRAFRDANILELCGWVAEVENYIIIEAEGEEGNLKTFIEQCTNGFSRKRPEKVEVEEKPLRHFGKFLIL